MPPRYAYWTIIAGGLPTAFRATDRAELEPTFQRIREKHPDAEMKWFARGKLWDSPEAARPARPPRDAESGFRRKGDAASGFRRKGDVASGFSRNRRNGDVASGFSRKTGAPSAPRDRNARGEHRGRDWRPGGEHRDPRQPYKDAKKARNQRWRAEKHERKQRDAGPRPDWRDRAPREKPHGDKLPGDRGRPFPSHEGSRRPDGNWRSRAPRERPHGDKLRAKVPQRAWPRGPRPARNQGTEEPPSPPRPRGPNREPRPNEDPRPSPPPRPSEPSVPPPGPPERGRPKAQGPRPKAQSPKKPRGRFKP